MDLLKKYKFWLFILFIVVLIFPTYSGLIRSGFFPMQDDLQAFRVYEMDKCFTDLQIPCRWVPDAGYEYGYPQFNFYPPLPYYIGAGLHRIGFQYIDSVKILFIAGYILSAITMYIFISTVFESSWIGFVVSILYTYIPYKAVEVYVRGALSEFWAQIFFPLIFWAIYKLIKSGKMKYVVLLSISILLLATTHLLMTMIFVPFAVFWALYILYVEKFNNFGKVFTSGLIGFGLSAFFILPAFFEKQFVHTESLLSGYFDYRQHFVSLYKLFLSREWGYGSSGFPNEKLNLSVGIVQWIVGIGAFLLALFNLKKNKKLALLTVYCSLFTLFSLFMIHMKSSFIWSYLPFLWYLQFPWRFLAVCIFLLCFLSAFTIYFSGKFKYLLGIVVIIISIALNISFFVPNSWTNITDNEKFSGVSWNKQLTISIFDYLPIYAKLPPITKAPDVPEVLEGEVKFLNYKKGSDFQTSNVEATKDSLIRAPIYDFPGMTVKIDERITPHINNDCRGETYCLGLVTFKVPVGNHSIEIRLQDSPIRRFGNTLTVFSLAIVVILLLKLRHR